jgi:hypothetical protein
VAEAEAGGPVIDLHRGFGGEAFHSLGEVCKRQEAGSRGVLACLRSQDWQELGRGCHFASTLAPLQRRPSSGVIVPVPVPEAEAVTSSHGTAHAEPDSPAHCADAQIHVCSQPALATSNPAYKFVRNAAGL